MRKLVFIALCLFSLMAAGQNTKPILTLPNNRTKLGAIFAATQVVVLSDSVPRRQYQFTHTNTSVNDSMTTMYRMGWVVSVGSIGGGIIDTMLFLRKTQAATLYQPKGSYRTMSNHDSLANLDEKSYNSLTDKPTIPPATDTSLLVHKKDSVRMGGYATQYDLTQLPSVDTALLLHKEDSIRGYLTPYHAGLTFQPIGNKILYVGSGQKYLTVNSALTVADSTYSIVIYPGTYYEKITLKNGVNIFGYGKNVTIIDTTALTAVKDNGTKVICQLSNLYFKSTKYVCLWLTNTSSEITCNNVTFESTTNYGALISGKLTGAKILATKLTGGNYGLDVSANGYAVDCWVNSNSGYGIHIDAGGKADDCYGTSLVQSGIYNEGGLVIKSTAETTHPYSAAFDNQGEARFCEGISHGQTGFANLGKLARAYNCIGEGDDMGISANSGVGFLNGNGTPTYDSAIAYYCKGLSHTDEGMVGYNNSIAYGCVGVALEGGLEGISSLGGTFVNCSAESKAPAAFQISAFGTNSLAGITKGAKLINCSGFSPKYPSGNGLVLFISGDSCVIDGGSYISEQTGSSSQAIRLASDVHHVFIRGVTATTDYAYFSIVADNVIPETMINVNSNKPFYNIRNSIDRLDTVYGWGNHAGLYFSKADSNTNANAITLKYFNDHKSSSSGTVTSISTTSPLTGGTITTTGTIAINNDTLTDWRTKQNKGVTAFNWGDYHSATLFPKRADSNTNTSYGYITRKYFDAHTLLGTYVNLADSNVYHHGYVTPKAMYDGLNEWGANYQPISGMSSYWLYADTSANKKLAAYYTTMAAIGLRSLPSDTGVNKKFAAYFDMTTKLVLKANLSSPTFTTQITTPKLIVTQPSITGGSGVNIVSVTGGSQSGVDVGSEVTDVNINLARTLQHNGGAITNQRSVIISTPTLTATSATTISDADGVVIQGPPTGGTNTTLTESCAVAVETKALTNVTTGYGLKVAAPTGATTNVAAKFTGNVNVTGRLYSDVVASGNSGTAITFDCSTSNNFTVTRTGNCTYTFSNMVAGQIVSVLMTHEASTTTYTVATSPTFTYPGGVTPVYTNTSGANDLLIVKYIGGVYICSQIADIK